MKTKHLDANSFDSEIFCKDVFHNYLKNHFPIFRIKWQDHPNGKNSPPDFNMILNGKIFSVEITETEIIQDTRRGDKINVRTFRASREVFIQKVEEEAQKEKILIGTYDIFFLMPWTVQLDSKVKKYLKTQITEYLVKSKQENQSGPHDIYYKDRIICQILKLNGAGQKIFVSFAQGAWQNSEENRNFVCQLLQNAISKKRRLLDKEPVPPPRILLIFNTYPFATSKIYMECVPNIQFLDFFHSVFVVISHSKTGLFLYTCDKE